MNRKQVLLLKVLEILLILIMKILKSIWQGIEVCSVGAFLMVVTAVVVKTITEAPVEGWSMLLALGLVTMGAVVIFYMTIQFFTATKETPSS